MVRGSFLVPCFQLFAIKGLEYMLKINLKKKCEMVVA